MLLVDVVAKSAFANGHLPVFDLEIDCAGNSSTPQNPHKITPIEIKQFADLANFFDSHDGQIIYLKVAISNDCVACGCSRLGMSRLRPGASEETGGEISIDSTPIHRRFNPTDVAVIEAGHEIAVDALIDGANVGFFYIPTYIQLPENGLYRRDGSGMFLSFDGPVVAQGFGYNGVRGGYFEPIQHASDGLLERVGCMRDRNGLSFFEKLRDGCL